MAFREPWNWCTLLPFYWEFSSLVVRVIFRYIYFCALSLSLSLPLCNIFCCCCCFVVLPSEIADFRDQFCCHTFFIMRHSTEYGGLHIKHLLIFFRMPNIRYSLIFREPFPTWYFLFFSLYHSYVWLISCIRELSQPIRNISIGIEIPCFFHFIYLCNVCVWFYSSILSPSLPRTHTQLCIVYCVFTWI